MRSLAWGLSVSNRQIRASRNLDTMIKERLRLFIRKNELSPSKIIVYCAGVSDGQYQQVPDKELPMTKKACKETCKNSSDIPITIIIVSQGHQRWFYPVEQARTDESSLVVTQPDKTAQQPDQKANPAARDHIHHPAGTIVDRDNSGVTSLLPGWDFFFQAHAASNKGNVGTPIHSPAKATNSRASKTHPIRSHQR